MAFTRNPSIDLLSEDARHHVIAVIDRNGKLEELTVPVIMTFLNLPASKYAKQLTALREVFAVLDKCESVVPFTPDAPLPVVKVTPQAARLLERAKDQRARELMRKSKRDRSKVSERLAAVQGWLCCYCHGKMTGEQNAPSLRTIEHLVELSCGGSNDHSNLIASCRACNNMRGMVMRPVHEFYIFRQRLLDLWLPCTLPADPRWLSVTRMLMSAHTHLREAGIAEAHVPAKEFLLSKLPTQSNPVPTKA